jgi:hypothetical protein
MFKETFQKKIQYVILRIVNQKWITYFICETAMTPGFQKNEWVIDCCLVACVKRKCIYFVFHFIDTVEIFQMCIYDHYMVPKII